MSNPLEVKIYLDSMVTGSMILKTKMKHYKISGLLDAIPLAAEVVQFIRSVDAGAKPHSLFTLADVQGRKYGFELRFADNRVYLGLKLKIEQTTGKMLFDWEGGFEAFKTGFKII
ncbi:hypothetical protein HDC92_003951 [Pedobacter sp. AK017]|uniref:hypothetical protein n=1 Tax=Pedobacter sp. AK017 TaxID=2723073 RepID=UPI00160F91B8|nr:hypothetical protein [Pedobacter sp. AK017]MBB5440251.1 hypothetical protein [Pedobacter sp. AK017]